MFKLYSNSAHHCAVCSVVPKLCGCDKTYTVLV